MTGEFMILLEQHFREQRHPEFYAARLNTTLYVLNGFTRRRFGKTVYELIQERLHQEALHLLMHSPMKVQDIAYELGCCDHGYFTRSFKRREGVGPRAYRDCFGSCATSQ